MARRHDFVEIARELVDTLERIRDTGFTDQNLIQRAKVLNAQLSPVYNQLLGRTQLIWTSYPAGIWWPRAHEDAMQALAALEGGVISVPTVSGGQASISEDSIVLEGEAPAEPEELVCLVIGPIGDSLAPEGSEPRRVYEESIEVFEKVITPACSALGLVPIRSDRLDRPGEITEQICRYLRDADVVVADLTDANPNVMYELGLRHTRNQLTVQIGEFERLPFDVSVIRTIRFRRTEAGVIDAKRQLQAALQAGLTGAYDPVTATRVWLEPQGRALSPSSESPGAAPVAEEEETGDDLGYLDLTAQAEEEFSAITETLNQIGEVIHELGSVTNTANDEIQRSMARSQGARVGLAIVTRYASSLEEPSMTLERLSLEYEQRMARIEPGMSYLIDQAHQDPGAPRSQELIQMIRTLAEAANAGMEGFRGFTSSVATLEPVSRTLRGPARRIRAALERVDKATGTIQDWFQRIEDLDT